jgi:hypothetical protein
MEIKDIDNYNTKYQRHGYQEWYHYMNKPKIKVRCNYKNGQEIGYEEWHKTHAESETNFYIK